MPIGVGAAIAGTVGAVGSIGSAIIGSNAASSAANEQAQADAKSLATQVDAENTSLATLAPYNDIGVGAAHDLANLYGIGYEGQGNGQATTSANGVITPGSLNASIGSPGGAAVEQSSLANFTNSPDYQFAFNQGLQALQRSAAASGTLASGGQMKASEEFGQGLASQQYGNYYNRLLSLAQIGQNAASGTASTSLAAGNSQANTIQAQGTAQASGTVGSANAISGGLTGIGSNITNSLLLSKIGGGSGSTSLSSYTNPVDSPTGGLY